MFEAVRSNKRITQVILAIMIVPFAFFGMDAYFSDGPGGGEVATVGDYSITVGEFDQALRNQQDRMRATLGSDFDRSVFDTPEFRRAVLDNLINERLLAQHAAQARLSVPPAALQRAIAEQSAFQENGSFSRERYQRLLQAQGMTPASFEARLAYDLRMQQIVDAVSESGFAGRESVRRLVLAQLEEREVSRIMVSADDFIDEIVLEDGAAEAYYDSNTARFERAPRLRAEYIVLDEAAVLALVDVDEGRARDFYEGNQDNYGQPEERRARHILIRLGRNADDAEIAAARERIEALAAELEDDPERFEALAREASEDPGSARAGGDLGYFGPGAMVPAFEEAAFALEQGDISAPVRSDFGFHLIQVTGIRAATVKPFDEVRDEILDELRRQEAASQYPLLAEQFANTVYEQPDSLEPAADPLGLEIRSSDWVTQDGTLNGYSDERLVRALFSADSLEHGENTEAVEVERGVMVAARVIEFEDAAVLPFDEVREEIEEMLRFDEAARRAEERGVALLEAARAGEVDEEWETGITTQRANPRLPDEAMGAIFAVSADDLPAFVGVSAGMGDYAVFRVDAVRQTEVAEDDPRVQSLARQYDRVVSELDVNAYLAALREEYKVEVRASALESAPR